MKITGISCVLSVILLVAVAFNVMAFDMTASDFRCGSRIITIGDYKYDVLRKCGEPSHVNVWQEVSTFGSQRLLVEEQVIVERWEYNLGPNNFIRYLRFENDRLRSITQGDYGF
jgi:hypothetical protein